MSEEEKIQRVLDETQILRYPEKLISTHKKTTLHYYVLAEPYYLEVFEEENPETKIREGEITWAKPKLLTPGYILKMEGFSDKAKKVLKMLARDNPDMAGLLYKLKYEKDFEQTSTVSHEIDRTYKKIEDELDENEDDLAVIIKGIDQYWDVCLMKFIRDLMMKSAFSAQLSDYAQEGYVRMDESGGPKVTRDLEGLPISAKEDIERMFKKVKKGDLAPNKLKKELDFWGVYSQYEDRFLELFRKE